MSYKINFEHPHHLEGGMADDYLQGGGFITREFHPIYDDRVNGGENMKKLYQAVILVKEPDRVVDTQWVTAEDKQQAFAKVDITEHNVDSVKVFLNKIGEY